METMVGSLTVYMIIGIIVIVGISQFNRILGSILGVVFWISVALIGGTAYDKGGHINLVSFEFSRSGFYIFCGAFVAFNLFNLSMAMKKRRRWQTRQSPSDDQ